eukprot:1189088-Prorocentrum_minimum.AAC.2
MHTNCALRERAVSVSPIITPVPRDNHADGGSCNGAVKSPTINDDDVNPRRSFPPQAMSKSIADARLNAFRAHASTAQTGMKSYIKSASLDAGSDKPSSTNTSSKYAAYTAPRPTTAGDPASAFQRTSLLNSQAWKPDVSGTRKYEGEDAAIPARLFINNVRLVRSSHRQ